MKKISTLDRVHLYTGGFSLVGAVILLDALTHLPEDLTGLLIFAGLSVIAELGSVELYVSSRQSRVSVSSMIAIAGILVFGPLAGALIHMTSGIATLVTTTLFSDLPNKGRASMLHRSAFNSGMLVTAAFIAGWVYILAGGVPGEVARWENILPATAAAAADTLVNLAILIGVITLQTHRQDFQWAIPIEIVGGVLGGGALALAYQMFGLLGLVVFFLPVLSTSYSIRLYSSKTKIYVNQLENFNFELLQTLGAVIDNYDKYTCGHSETVARYARDIARILCLSKSDQEMVYKAALVHDIGKVGIEDSIISKEGTLTDAEYNIIKRHPVIGAEILSRMEGLAEIIPLVKYHHERWDGRGYPEGLVGEEIPLTTRILTLADTLDVVFSDRPYRATFSFREAKEEILRCSGTQFDPHVVDAFLALVEQEGVDYFKNSAAAVDKALILKGKKRIGQGAAHFLKGSMVE
jgi:putative nucleotidyltransferase with HDIG domain